MAWHPALSAAALVTALAAPLLAVGGAEAAGAAQAGPCIAPRGGPASPPIQATYYHPTLHSQVMANGRPYDAQNPSLAASNRYRLGTVLRVRRADGAATVVVEVVDRGGDALDLDLSEAAFRRLAPLDDGRVAVCVETIN